MDNPIYAEETRYTHELKSIGLDEGRLSNVFNQNSEIFIQYEILDKMHPNRIFNLGVNSLLDMFPLRKLNEVLK